MFYIVLFSVLPLPVNKNGCAQKVRPFPLDVTRGFELELNARK